MPTAAWWQIRSSSERKATAAVSETDIKMSPQICSRPWLKFSSPRKTEFVSLSRWRNVLMRPTLRTVAQCQFHKRTWRHWVRKRNENPQNSGSQQLFLKMHVHRLRY
jgi:hypothetical protein